MSSLVIELGDEELRALRVLSPSLKAGVALARLIECVRLGVRDPRTPARVWVEQVFGSEWIDRMVQDPDCEWRQVSEGGLFDD